MEMLFISDNYYLCAGMSRLKMQVFYLEQSCGYVNVIQKEWGYGLYIIAIKDHQKRTRLIKYAMQRNVNCIAMVNGVLDGMSFRLDSVVYTSMKYDLKRFNRLLSSYSTKEKIHFTPREKMVFGMLNLTNQDMANRLGVTEKCASGYRQNILHKMKMKNRNSLVFLRE